MIFVSWSAQEVTELRFCFVSSFGRITTTFGSRPPCFVNTAYAPAAACAPWLTASTWTIAATWPASSAEIPRLEPLMPTILMSLRPALYEPTALSSL